MSQNAKDEKLFCCFFNFCFIDFFWFGFIKMFCTFGAILYFYAMFFSLHSPWFIDSRKYCGTHIHDTAYFLQFLKKNV